MEVRGRNMLTSEKHHRVIDEYFINGFDCVKAYKSVYDNDSTDAVATINFKRLIKQNSEYFKYCQKNNRERSMMDRDYILEKLRYIIEENFEDPKTVRHALSAIDTVCKVNGLYSPEEVDVRHEINGISITINKAKRIEDSSTSFDDFQFLE